MTPHGPKLLVVIRLFKFQDPPKDIIGNSKQKFHSKHSSIQRQMISGEVEKLKKNLDEVYSSIDGRKDGYQKHNLKQKFLGIIDRCSKDLNTMVQIDLKENEFIAPNLTQVHATSSYDQQYFQKYPTHDYPANDYSNNSQKEIQYVQKGNYETNFNKNYGLSSEQDPRLNHGNFSEVKSHMQYQGCPDQQNLENSGPTSQKILEKHVGFSENNSLDNIPAGNGDLGHKIQQFNGAPLNLNSHGQPVYQTQTDFSGGQQNPSQGQQAHNSGYHPMGNKIQTPKQVLPFVPNHKPPYSNVQPSQVQHTGAIMPPVYQGQDQHLPVQPQQFTHGQNLLQNSGFESSNDESQNSSDHNQDPNLDAQARENAISLKDRYKKKNGVTEIVHQNSSGSPRVNGQNASAKNYPSKHVDDNWGNFCANEVPPKSPADVYNSETLSMSMSSNNKDRQDSSREIVDLSMPRCNNDSGAYQRTPIDTDPNCLDFNPS